MRRFSRETQRNYLRDVGRFARFLGRSPDTATADDVRQFQIVQHDAGMPVPTMNGIVSALRFFFTITVDRLDLARKLVRGRFFEKAAQKFLLIFGRSQRNQNGLKERFLFLLFIKRNPFFA